MNCKVPFSILQLRRLENNHGVLWRFYCSALKPQIQREINCFDIMFRNEPYPAQVGSQTNLTKVFQNSAQPSASKILNKMYEGQFSVSNFVKSLEKIKLQLLHTHSSFSLKSDSRFIALCELLEANCQQSSPFLLISALKRLLALDVDQEAKVIETIGKTILQKIDEFDGNDMVECLLLLHSSKNITDTQKEIVAIMLKEIPQNIHDITSGPSVFKLIRVYDRFDKHITKKFDFKLAGLIKYFSPSHLCNALCLLAEKQSRNKTLLNAISQSIQNSEKKPSIKQTVDILYALKSLNYPDLSLLLYLTDGRTTEIFEIPKPSLISSLLTACGHLRWRHEEIMEACGKWILSNIDKCGSREFVSYILTAASLNYTSSDAVLNHLLPCLKEEKITPSTVWLDVVWSLAILGYTDNEMLCGVFMKDFCEPLLDGDDFRVMSNKLKLMNLKSVLKSKYPEYTFSCDLFLDSVEVPISSEVENSKRSVIDALGNFILPGKYMYTNQCTNMGISIDAEFIMDDKGKPLPLSEYGSKIKSDVLTKILPPDAKRIAVLVLTHKDFTLNEPHVTGLISLTTEILKSQDYVVIQIPYNEFSENLTTVKRAHYLQEKIMTAIECSFVEKKM